MKHTAGPWKVAYAVESEATILGPSGGRIAYVRPYDGGDFKAVQPNARLIAAAPELLEALLLKMNPLTNDQKAHDKALAAIAKANGSSNED